MSVDGRLVIAGGLLTDGTSTDGVMTVDPGTGAIVHRSRLLSAGHDAAGTVRNGFIYLFGGGTDTSVATVQKLTESSGAVSLGALPTRRSDLVAVSTRSAMYLVGGYDGRVWSADVLRTTDGIHFGAPLSLPIPVRYASAVVVGGQLWVFGGLAQSGPTAAIQHLDLATGSAQVVGRLRTTLTNASAVVLEGQVYLCGGLADGVATAAITRFDPRSRAFTSAGTLPTALHDAGSAVVGDTGFLVGGETPAQTTSRVVRLQLAPGRDGA